MRRGGPLAAGLLIALAVSTSAAASTSSPPHQPAAAASQTRTEPGSRGLVALTFDDGPTPAYTARVLDLLHKHGVKATFFLQGSHVAAYPDLVRRIKAEGHTIGNHGYTHPDFTTLSDEEADREITSTNTAIAAVTGSTPVLFRYPYGNESAGGNEVIRREGMWGGVLWHWTNSLPGDFECPGATAVARYVRSNAVDQGLILLHDGNDVTDCGLGQLRYLDIVIPQLKHDGFSFGVVDIAFAPSPVNQQSWVQVVRP
ncbi:polysaccharide deacetylase family protein [Luteipulveratus halotolerans]|uniref:polysaccharide deacetylase family protein n=1 Tax=Luteipulveratus halotolerans TaxID=1631356 RepID=UPI000682490A|nr:polysaccharide deacetylase family protein [Luteipulveratus halotolerans]